MKEKKCKPNITNKSVAVRLTLLKREFENSFKAGGYSESFRSGYITAINQAIIEAKDYVSMRLKL